ncbi:MAG: agmatinase [Clostridiales bacterium]|nr:agmatinase [Clostridiales bacterium]
MKTHIPKKHEGIFSSYAESDVVIFGVPYDGTTSYRPGTRFGPSAIRQEIDGIETYSPYLDRDLSDYKICDLGDMPMNFGGTEKVLEKVRHEIRSILGDEKKTVVIGGEHLISLPLIEAYIEKHPNLHVIQFDAHADLRNEFVNEKLSHATVMRRIFEKLNGELWQFGIRSGTRDEFAFADKNTNINLFNLNGIKEATYKIGSAPVYITLDIDVLDPSIMPGTGTPEAGGISFVELMEGIKALCGLNIVGADIMELSPHYDQSGVSTSVACKTLRELLLVVSRKDL